MQVEAEAKYHIGNILHVYIFYFLKSSLLMLGKIKNQVFDVTNCYIFKLSQSYKFLLRLLEGLLLGIPISIKINIQKYSISGAHFGGTLLDWPINNIQVTSEP